MSNANEISSEVLQSLIKELNNLESIENDQKKMEIAYKKLKEQYKEDDARLYCLDALNNLHNQGYLPINKLVSQLNQSKDSDNLIKQFNDICEKYDKDIANNKEVDTNVLIKILQDYLEYKKSEGNYNQEQDMILAQMESQIEKYFSKNIGISVREFSSSDTSNKKSNDDESKRIFVGNKLNLLINTISIDKNKIAQNSPQDLNLLVECEKKLKEVKEDYDKHIISPNECEEIIYNYNNKILNIFNYDILGDSYEQQQPSLQSGQNLSRSNFNTDAYDDIIVDAKNYIRLMENNQIYVTRSKEAIQKGKSTNESIERYSDLLKETQQILRSAKNGDESPVILENRLNNVIKALKDEYDLDITMLKTPKRHKIYSVKRIFYGIGGIGLGLFGIRRIMDAIKLVTGLSISFLSIPATFWTFALLGISGDLLRAAVNSREKTLLEKIISNLINENKSSKKGRTK